MTKDYMDEEQKILTEFGGDPLLKLKSRELDIKARADEAKRAYDEGRIRFRYDESNDGSTTV